MSRNARVALVLVGIAILAGAAFLISGGDDSKDATVPDKATPSTGAPSGATGSTATGGATSGGGKSGGSTTDTGGARPEDDNGSGTGGARPEDDNGTGGAGVSSQQGPLLVAGKVAKISTKQGGTVYLRARSATADELHIHGYDYKVQLPAGKTVSYKFKGDIAGVFEIEFEEQGLQVATLKVNP